MGRSRGFGERTLPTPRPAPPRRGQARGLTADECATVLATCLRPRRIGRGLERRRISHGGRVGLAVELTARGASTHAIQLAGG